VHGLIFETSICYWQDQPDFCQKTLQSASHTDKTAFKCTVVKSFPQKHVENVTTNYCNKRQYSIERPIPALKKLWSANKIDSKKGSPNSFLRESNFISNFTFRWAHIVTNNQQLTTETETSQKSQNQSKKLTHANTKYVPK
jgi:hypothetical protein